MLSLVFVNVSYFVENDCNVDRILSFKLVSDFEALLIIFKGF